ncbi:helix-turn-helix transcriptional regulator [Nonomuraea basaltis]|uniref:helix-turn-helix transcriptional regulator n=1 Tax=Nonomuraea basaltis TaxID=2495887 RepID=UPI001F0F52EA|nr:helix-turn-helix domain-containing protein [Nonomuraea basaltis]
MTVKISPSARRALGKPLEVADYLGIPEATLKQWRWLGKGPKFVPVGRHVRYRWSDVETWLDEQAGAA